MIKCITANLFRQYHLNKRSNKKNIVPETMRTVIDDLETMGEKQLETFVSDQLVVSRVSISRKITLSKIKIWDHTDTGQLKCKAEFFRSKSALKKMNSEKMNTEKLWLKNCLNMKLTSNYSIKLYHG